MPVGDDIAVGASVTVSSQFSDEFAGELAGDGDDGWITVDLGSPQDVAAVEFVTRSMLDGSAITSTFTVSVDGAAPLGPFDAATPATSRPAAVDATGQAFRFDVEHSSGGNVGAVEVRLFAPPR